METTTGQRIVMYARDTYCPDVSRARRRLAHHGLEWTEFNVEVDDAARDRMREITGRGSVPTLLIGDRVLIEPSAAEIDEALEAASLLPAVVASSS